MTLSLAIHDDAARSRAAALLGPAGPGRLGDTRFASTSRPRATGSDPRLRGGSCGRIDAEGIRGRLELVESQRQRGRSPSQVARARSRPSGRRRSRCSRPTGATSSPSSSSTRAPTSTARAVLCAPINPSQIDGTPGLPFPLRERARLRRLRRDGRPLPRAGSTRPGSPAASGSHAPSATCIPWARRARPSWSAAARPDPSWVTVRA